MLQFDEERTRALLPWSPLVEAIREMFRSDCEMPAKHEHFVKVPGETDAKLLLMPAWTTGGMIAVKIACVVPGNSDRGLPAVNATVLLMDALTGQNLALVDGGEVTARRTAASSALAADYLARPDSSHLFVMGTGRLGGNDLIEAHAAVRPIRKLTVWGRSPGKAADVAQKWKQKGLDASSTEDVASAAGEADIVSTATLAPEPILKGDWLRPGTHVDLVGNFAPTARESDDAVMQRGTVFVDTRAALKTGGDLVIALANGAIRDSDIAADLFELTRGIHPGRTDPEQITVFKSVGAAIEDFAAARLVYEAARSG